MVTAETGHISLGSVWFDKQSVSVCVTSLDAIAKAAVHYSDLYIQANKCSSAHLLSSTLSSNHVVLKRL